jgi:hypothetical protein
VETTHSVLSAQSTGHPLDFQRTSKQKRCKRVLSVFFQCQVWSGLLLPKMATMDFEMMNILHKYTDEIFKVPRQVDGKSAVSNSLTIIVVSINIKDVFKIH